MVGREDPSLSVKKLTIITAVSIMKIHKIF